MLLLQSTTIAEQPGTYRVNNREDVGSLNIYFKSVGRYALLTREEEQFYARRLQNGEQQARQTMVLCNQRLVISVAKRYRSTGLSLLELIAEGNLGLLQAVDNFNPDVGVKFCTYAFPWVLQAIQRALLAQNHLLSVPYRVSGQIRKVKRLQKQSLSEADALAEVAQQLDLQAHEVQRLQDGLNQVRISLDDAQGIPKDGLQLVRQQNQEFCPYHSAWKNSRRALIEELLHDLPVAERTILRMRFGLFDGKEHSLEEVAQVIGQSREKIRRWQLTILQKLRRRLEHKGMNAKLLF